MCADRESELVGVTLPGGFVPGMVDKLLTLRILELGYCPHSAGVG